MTVHVSLIIGLTVQRLNDMKFSDYETDEDIQKREERKFKNKLKKKARSKK